ncbi:MAG TPA: hypothetical protein DCF33_11520 [Saprospirales bacterium]|nr:hypothetical protein [Saprospirales bacterium]
MSDTQAPLKTFIIYARDDKAYKDQLIRHLRPLVSSSYLNVWHDGDILPGEDWEKKIKSNLKTSQLVLVLVSVNCLNSEFIEGEELTTAVAQLKDGHTRIVPIIVSPCGWRFHKLFVGLQGLPEDMKPVSEWPNPDKAWTNVVESLASIVDETRAEQAAFLQQQQKAAEQARLAALAAEQEARRKAEEEAQARARQEQQEREAAELQRQKAAEKERLDTEARQKAEAARLRREAGDANGGSNKFIFAGLGVVVLVIIYLAFFPPWKTKKPEEEAQEVATQQGKKPSEPTNFRKDDQKAYDAAKKLGTLPAWEKYLQQYPSGLHAEEARQQISNLKKQIATKFKQAKNWYNLEEPDKARPLLDDILRLDPDHADAQRLKQSLK